MKWVVSLILAAQVSKAVWRPMLRVAARLDSDQLGTRSETTTGAPNTLPASGATPPEAPTFLRLAAGFVYFYFGFLKLFPNLSPAELLSGQTLMRLSLNWLDAHTVVWWLAVVECIIGLSFLFNAFMRWVFFLFLIHQAGTFLPLFLLPELTFKIAPFAPTLEGQYIFKNLISVAAGWTVMLPAVKAAWKKPDVREGIPGQGQPVRKP